MRLAAALALAAVLAAPMARAQQESEIERLLKLPPSPGVEALLVAHVRDPRVVPRWQALLTHPEAALRLTAARVLGVSAARFAAPDLFAALAREEDPAAAAELLQALVVVAADADLPRVYAHLDRIGELRAAPILDGLTASRPALMAEQLTSAEALRASQDWAAAVYHRLARTVTVDIRAVDAAVAAANVPALFEGVVRGATSAHRRLPPSLVVAALANAAVHREPLVNHFAAAYGSPEQVRQEIAFRDVEPGPAAADDSADDLWWRELLRRWLGRPSGTNLETVIPSLPEAFARRDAPGPVLMVLTRAERSAFARRFNLNSRDIGRLVTASPALPGPPTVATLHELPGPILQDILRVTGCEWKRGDERFAPILYRPDRRPQHVGLPPGPWPAGCERAARAVTTLAMGPPPRAETERTQMLIRLDEEFASCLADRDVGGPDAPDTIDQSDVRAPRKVRDAKPVYPAVAQAQNLEGTVVVEAVIERTGCIADARIVGSVHPILDASALRAVAHWRYTPTLIKDRPVAVIMTVTVNFSLK